MYPIELLTNEDRLIINEYLEARGYVLSNLDNVLNNWNKNKKTLLKIFGNKLRISFPIETETRSDYLKQQLEDFYVYPKNLFTTFYGADFTNKDIRSMINQDPKILIETWNLKNDFILDTFYFFVVDNDISLDNYRYFLYLLDYDSVYSNYYSGMFPLIFTNPNKDKELVIKSGIKIMRAIRKVLDYFDYKSFDLFEKWRDGVSTIRTTKKTDSNLILSIHPIDFITLSDNNSNWSSCLGWTNKGCYSNGTLELLNSNMVAVCYIENPNSKYIISDTDHTIPNKMWRAIAYIHKKIILIGKNYPFSDENISKQALSFLEEIIKENIHWEYKYHQQEYRDMIYFENTDEMNHGSIDDIKYLIDRYNGAYSGKHIFLGGNNVYNDLATDPTYKYYCSRNWVKQNLFLNISGKCPCLICGEEIDETGSLKICYTCKTNFDCFCCDKIDSSKKHYRIKTLENFYDRSYYYKYKLEELPSYAFQFATLCEDCLKEKFETNEIVFFKNKEKNHTVLIKNNNRQQNKYYYEKYRINFYAWYYQSYVLEKYLPDIPNEKLIEDMKEYFEPKIYSIDIKNIDKIGQKYITEVS